MEANASRWTPQRNLTGTPAAAERRGGARAAPDDEGERGCDDAVPLRRVRSPARPSRARPSSTRLWNASRRTPSSSRARRRRPRRLVAATAETRPGRRRGVQSNAASTCSAPWARTRPARVPAPERRGARRGGCPRGRPALAAVILLLGLVGLLASCFGGRGPAARPRRRAIATLAAGEGLSVVVCFLLFLPSLCLAAGTFLRPDRPALVA